MVAFVLTLTFRCCCGENYDIKKVAQYCRPSFEPGACTLPAAHFFACLSIFDLVPVRLDFGGRK
jgi:hypothetical protein